MSFLTAVFGNELFECFVKLLSISELLCCNVHAITPEMVRIARVVDAFGCGVWQSQCAIDGQIVLQWQHDEGFKCKKIK